MKPYEVQILELLAKKGGGSSSHENKMLQNAFTKAARKPTDNASGRRLELAILASEIGISPSLLPDWPFPPSVPSVENPFSKSQAIMLT